eukprot:2521740-Rhodomonas_salina.1
MLSSGAHLLAITQQRGCRLSRDRDEIGRTCLKFSRCASTFVALLWLTLHASRLACTFSNQRRGGHVRRR